ncbi:hypothetical protein TRVA0_051S00540 [Trichomonascus vanleenenianus]|uniref:uncharacterized protein n=1 Tax=Trichomonascus vanleenenianus TaxID=2268995 RepID=UPI003ECA62E6
MSGHDDTIRSVIPYMRHTLEELRRERTDGQLVIASLAGRGDYTSLETIGRVRAELIEIESEIRELEDKLRMMGVNV